MIPCTWTTGHQSVITFRRKNVTANQPTRYTWHPEIPDGNHLIGSLILVALTAGFGTLAFFSLLHSYLDLRSGPCSFFLVVSCHHPRLIIALILPSLLLLFIYLCFHLSLHHPPGSPPRVADSHDSPLNPLPPLSPHNMGNSASPIHRIIPLSEIRCSVCPSHLGLVVVSLFDPFGRYWLD
jgi:hypothetical protein